MTSKIKTKRLKWLAALLLLVAAMVMPSVAWAYNQPNGEGTKESPYQIGTAEELYWFAAYVNGDPGKENGNYTACAELTDDITVSGTWTPIMNYNGTFDGRGHTISGLLKTISGGGDIGLFGTTQEGSVICNVGIVNCSFRLIGGGSVGGVCGTNEGTITNCYNTGTVDGTPGLVGGICGTNNGTIKNCYNTGSVNNGQESGGVCGLNYENGTITNCYYLSGTATGGIYNNGTGSAEVKDATQFASGEVAWLLNGKRSVGTTGNPLAWYQNIGGDSYPVLDSGHGTVYCGYKDCTLSYSNNQAELRESPVHHYDNGICKACKAYKPAELTTGKYDFDGNNDTKDEVYEIGNAGQLYWFAGLVNGTLNGVTQNKSANAVLTADIIVNESVIDSNGELKSGDFISWTPIGTQENPYSGTFDGDGHTISGLYFNDKNKVYVGLFGKSNGTIKNVGVVNSYFYGYCIVGAVCGENNGTIQNCYNNSTVKGTKSIGGICGIIDSQGKIFNCYNVGKVNGAEFIGGVCGNNNNGTITNCYNNSTVKGKVSIGGICGIIYSQGKIFNCYNVGVISNVNQAGGVCGINHSATITNCYYLSGTATGGINGADASGSAEGKAEWQFASGEVAYLLNEGKAFGTQVWGQQLEVNNYPVLGSDYKVIRAAKGDMDANGDYPYWATFSNQSGDSDLGGLNVYTAKVSNGVLTITRCSDKIVAKGEGVLVKGSAEYLNTQMLNTTSANAEANNDLVATPATAETITAGEGYTLYRLTYDDVDAKKDLGFYLGVVGESIDGSKLNATPNKAYLKVATPKVTQVSGAAIRGFVFPGDDGETTGIECISVTNESLHRNGNANGIFDLQGRKVSKPTNGLYIKNNKKILIKN